MGSNNALMVRAYPMTTPLHAGQLDSQVLGDRWQGDYDASMVDYRGKYPDGQRAEYYILVASALVHELRGIRLPSPWMQKDTADYCSIIAEYYLSIILSLPLWA